MIHLFLPLNGSSCYQHGIVDSFYVEISFLQNLTVFGIRIISRRMDFIQPVQSYYLCGIKKKLEQGNVNYIYYLGTWSKYNCHVDASKSNLKNVLEGDKLILFVLIF